jgi:hypothetical protein
MIATTAAPHASSPPEAPEAPEAAEIEIDMRSLRAELAARQITHTAFARTCGLSRVFVGRILAGNCTPGELGRIKLLRGVRALGLLDAS